MSTTSASPPVTAGKMVDRTALKVNQTGIVTTVLVAFVASPLLPQTAILVPALALVLLLGTAAPRAALFKQFYFKVLKPRGLLKPQPSVESPRPHEFAQLLGGVFLTLASVAFALGAATLGWGLALLVVVLAAVNLFFGFCLGCQIFFRLERLKLVKS